MKKWPEGLATVTVRWDDGSEVVVNRVKVGPDELVLALDEQPPYVLGRTYSAPPPVTRGWFTLNSCEMTPDDEDCFYTIRMGE